jgi:hypothetical protein
MSVLWMYMDYNLSSVASCRGIRPRVYSGFSSGIVIHIHPQHSYCLSSFWGKHDPLMMVMNCWNMRGNIWNASTNNTTTLMHLLVTSTIRITPSFGDRTGESNHKRTATPTYPFRIHIIINRDHLKTGAWLFLVASSGPVCKFNGEGLVLCIVTVYVRVYCRVRLLILYISNKHISGIIHINTLIILNIQLCLSNRAYRSFQFSCQYCLHPAVAVVTVLCLFGVKPMCNEHFNGFEGSFQVWG